MGIRHLAQDSITISNSKHIEVRHHFIRDLVARNGNFSNTCTIEFLACRFLDQRFSAGGVNISPRSSHGHGLKILLTVLFFWGGAGVIRDFTSRSVE